MRSRQSCRTMLASPSTPMTISSSRFNNHNFSIYCFNVVNHRRCIMLNLNKTITVGWPWWWDRQSRPIQQVRRFPKTLKHQRWLHRNVPFAPVSFGNSSFYRRRARGCELPSKLEVRFAFQTDPGVKITIFLNTQVANPCVCIPHPCPQSGLCYIWLQVEKITMIMMIGKGSSYFWIYFDT